MKIYEYTNKGSRECNQDFLAHAALSADSAIFVAADGMGGYSQGEVASRLVAESIVEFVETNYQVEKPAALLRKAIAYANEALIFKRLALGGSKMGTVVAILLILNNEAYISWLGDSRVYLYRNSQEIYRTEDHSVVNDMLKLKTVNISAETLEKYSHIVTKSVMGDDKMGDIPVSMIESQASDTFILCTDGYYREGNMETALNYKEYMKSALEQSTSMYSDNNSFIKVEI